MSEGRRIKPLRARRAAPNSETTSNDGANPNAEASSSSTSQSQPQPEGTNNETAPSVSESTADALPSHIGVFFPQLSQHAPPYDPTTPSLFNFNRFSSLSVAGGTLPSVMENDNWETRYEEEATARAHLNDLYNDQAKHVSQIETAFEKSEKEVLNLEDKVHEIEAKLKDYEEKLEQEYVNVNETKIEVQRQVEQVEKLTAEIQGLRDEGDAKQKTITEKNAAIKQLDAEINTAQSEVLAAIEACDREEFKLDTLQRQYNELVEDHKLLQEELGRFTAASAELSEITSATFDHATALVDKDEEIHDLRKKVAYCHAHHEADVPDPDDLPEAVGPLEQEQAQKSPKKSPKSDLGEELMDIIDTTLDSSGDVEDNRSTSNILTIFEEPPLDYVPQPSTRTSPRIIFEESSIEGQPPRLTVLSPQTVIDLPTVEHQPHPSTQIEPQTVIDEPPMDYQPRAFGQIQPQTILDQPPVEWQPSVSTLMQLQTIHDEAPAEHQPPVSTHMQPQTIHDESPVDYQPPIPTRMQPQTLLDEPPIDDQPSISTQSLAHTIVDEPPVENKPTTSTKVAAHTIFDISPVTPPDAPAVDLPSTPSSTPLTISKLKTLIDVAPMRPTAHHTVQVVPWWVWIMIAVALVQTLLARRERSMWLGANDEAQGLLGSFGGSSGESMFGAAANAFVTAALGLSEGEIGEARAMMY